MKYKASYDHLANSWRILEKEMIFVGKLTWTVYKSGFLTKGSATKYINENLI